MSADIIRVANKVTTTNATPTVIVNYLMQNNTACQCYCRIVGKDVAGLAVCTYYKMVSFKCFNNIASIVGGTNLITPHEDGGLSGANILEAVSGANAQFKVTGVAGKTIEWCAVMDVHFN